MASENVFLCPLTGNGLLLRMRKKQGEGAKVSAGTGKIEG
jgi:hypothetical protein